MKKRSRQDGSILIVSLIMLTILMFMAITSFQLDKSSTKIVTNAQIRVQGSAAAQEAIDKTVSSLQFSGSPTNAITTPCNGVPNTVCIDNNGDGVPDVAVKITPQCRSIQTVSNASLNLADAEDKGCALGINQDFGTAGASTSNSMCANILWDIGAIANDQKSRAQVTINQGVAIRAGAAGADCP